jgi:hypothetical protein
MICIWIWRPSRHNLADLSEHIFSDEAMALNTSILSQPLPLKATRSISLFVVTEVDF